MDAVWGFFRGDYVSNALIVAGDDQATLRSIVAHAALWKMWLGANLVVPLRAVVQ
ncbi:hypothetical protein AZ54_04555 [Xanthomonas oryzae pv. oryzae PXO86]|uniref:hypothetical protein n=1 Tax=Xanthomonas oryzae TaxID=347 RepID=UPI0005D78CC8|nr:hypothetical protein [Xanthomonas oryzae]AJQ81985.1 hypothetical protein AZ54_04555 [Xanthomonas oryzae pv. oryzae PXO86]